MRLAKQAHRTSWPLRGDICPAPRYFVSSFPARYGIAFEESPLAGWENRSAETMARHFRVRSPVQRFCLGSELVAAFLASSFHLRNQQFSKGRYANPYVADECVAILRAPHLPMMELTSPGGE
uniref:Uncharacterized protein n=1 Tax=Sphaerodactylus townsendi TaxID=933632 RepID=A0ACB8F9A5_9SAUR